MAAPAPLPTLTALSGGGALTPDQPELVTAPRAAAETDATTSVLPSGRVLPLDSGRPRWLVPAGVGAGALVLLIAVIASGAGSDPVTEQCESQWTEVAAVLGTEQEERFMDICEAGLWNPSGGPAPDYERESRLQVEQFSVKPSR